MDKQRELNQIANEITLHAITPDLKDSATQLVMGDGNLDADIVLIGEAPGKEEDERGRPFVGRSGLFLEEMLQSQGLKREDVYITNIVKYRPPANRDPKRSERLEFAPYLARELEVISPRVVMTLGRISMNYFMPKAKIGDVHGKVFTVDFHGQELLLAPLYHPSYALRNMPKNGPILMGDFQRVMNEINTQ